MKKLLPFVALLCQVAFGALPATGIINIVSTGTAGNLNGGGFNSARGGTNYSLQNAAQLTAGDGSAAGTTTFTSVTGGFTTAMEGNYIHLTASTGLTVGWYEIVTRTDTNNVVLDRTPGTGTATTYYVGGALSFGSATAGRTDDDALEIGVAGNIFYIKGAVSYSVGSVNISAAGGASNPIWLIGYTTTQGDACNGTSRPTLAAAANNWNFGNNWNAGNLIFTTTGGSGVNTGTGSSIRNCKATNSGTSANQAAWTINSDTNVYNCEGISYRGNAFVLANGAQTITGCWAHDSNVGFNSANTNTSGIISFCISSSHVTAAFRLTGAATAALALVNNTLFGSTNTTGIGVSLATGVTDIRLINNIITGFVTGVVHADTQSVGFDDYNDYYNNDADVSAAGQWQKGANDSAVNPSFTSAGQVTGTNATISSSTLTSSGADFTAAGVVAGRDFVYLVSGTAGPTFGIYGITAVGTTTLTLDIAPGNSATADHVFQITIGQNFAVGTAMKALGFPGAFQGSYTTGYADQGAVQRQEAASGGQKSYSF